LWWSSSAFESPAVVAGRDDVAVVSEAIEERGSHLGVAEDARPFAEGEIGRDDDRGAFVEPADETEEELAAGLGEEQIVELIENDEVHAGEVIGEPTLPAAAGLDLESVDEIDDLVEPARAPARMQLRAMAVARGLFPVPGEAATYLFLRPNSSALSIWP
jgi:hypothetical protein